MNDKDFELLMESVKEGGVSSAMIKNPPGNLYFHHPISKPFANMLRQHNRNLLL